MCDTPEHENQSTNNYKTVPVSESVGLALGHDITEIKPGQFKGRAFSKGHIVQKEDICKLRDLGKENLFILDIPHDEMHEDEAVEMLAHALAGQGVSIQGSPHEGKLDLTAARDGLLKINKDALLDFNMLSDVMCATMHTNTVVTKGQRIAGTRAIPLTVKRSIVQEAVAISKSTGDGAILEVRQMFKPKAGIVITGNEVYHGRIKDAFGSVIREKVATYGGEVVGLHYAPDDKDYIARCLKQLMDDGANLLITTGGMSVDPDDVTRFAVRELGAEQMEYGSPVLPGAMLLVAYINNPLDKQNSIPLLGIPACGMYSKTTVLDLVLPRVLAKEPIGRRELAELGHGGLCLKCKECRWPVCPFGK